MVILPRGARNIRINEEPATTNRLALKARSRGTNELTSCQQHHPNPLLCLGPWILNGSFAIEEEVFTMHFITSGTSFTYTSTKGLETMSAKGPLLSDLALMVNDFAL